MLVSWHVLADAASTQYKHQLFIGTMAIAGVCLAAALVLAWVRRLNQRKPPVKLNSSEQLAEFRVLYERGELSNEEFQRLRAVLSERIKEELAAQQAPAEPTEDAGEIRTQKAKEDGKAGSNGPPVC